MKTLLIASLGIILLLALSTRVDLLSLHDIRSDYVSQSALDYLGIEVSRELPSWTNTRLEWTSIRISVAVRVVLILWNLVLLLWLLRGLAGGASTLLTQDNRAITRGQPAA